MNTKALRQKVLDLAIHGKLVPQNPNDESATVLLEKIRAEKAEKIKKGELKVDKKDSFIFVGSDKRHYEQFVDGTVLDIEDELPFEVPEGWAWCRLKNICTDFIVPQRDKPKSFDGTIPWCRIEDIEGKYLNGSLSGQLVTEETIQEMNMHKCPVGSIICSCSASLGIQAITTVECCTNQTFIGIVPNDTILFNEYLYFMLKAQTEYFHEIATGTTIKYISRDKFEELFVALPPIEEQKLIVDSINNTFNQIELLDQNKDYLQTTIRQAKSKILDLAIHGKLVPQDSNDEPAEELLKRIATSDNRPYKKIDEDEVLFDIPESWSWCTLGEIYTHTTGKALKKTNNKGTLRKYITTSNLYWNTFDFTEVREMYFTDDELEKCTIKKGDLILCNGGDVGRAAIWNYNYDICYQNHVSRLRPKDKDINNSFFLYLIMIYKQQGMLNGKGVGITSLSASDLLSAIVPLPPYSEQKRIVEKIECLYGYLTTINNQL